MNQKLPDEPLVSIYVCQNPAELPVVESLLNEAGIQFMKKGAELQSLFGWGQIGGTNLAVGPVELYVLPRDAEAAIALLESSLPETPSENG
jgi:hypothetical protein